MRVMATVLPGLGHLNPMVPLLRELSARGHAVEVVVPQPFTKYVEQGGLDAVGLGPSWTEMEIDDLYPGWHSLDGSAQLRVWVEVASRFRPYLERHIEQRPPDVIVHDHFEFAAWMVGEKYGIPTVPFAMTIRALDPTFIQLADYGADLGAMREAAGLPGDVGIAGGGRWLYLDAMPPSLTSALLPPPPTVRHLEYVSDDTTGGSELPRGLVERSRERPLVYATLGTIFNRRADVLSRLLIGVGDLDADVLMTVGDGAIPEQVPPNVEVHRYLPQSSLYPSLAAVVCHGGFGTVFGALSHGVPVVCAPIAADQPVNAVLVAGAGAGLNLAEGSGDEMFPALADGEPVPAEVTRALERVLIEDEFRTRAANLAKEIAGGAKPGEAAALIERVVESGLPHG